MIAVDISAFVAVISAHDVDDCVMYVLDHSYDLAFDIFTIIRRFQRRGMMKRNYK